MKESKIEKYFDIAKSIAQLSPDEDTKAGSILLREDGSIIGASYNGHVRKTKKLPTTRPNKYNFMIHSEANLIYNSSRHGIPTLGTFVICTQSPCPNCIRTLYQAGIFTIYFKEEHLTFDDTLNMEDIYIKMWSNGSYKKIDLIGVL